MDSQKNRHSRKRASSFQGGDISSSNKKVKNTNMQNENAKATPIEPGFEKLEMGNYAPEIFLNLVKSNDIKIHHKDLFIDNLRNLKAKRNDRKQFLLNIREHLFNQIVQTFYQDNDVILASDQVLKNVLDDIHVCCSTIIENRLIDAIHDIIVPDEEDGENSSKSDFDDEYGDEDVNQNDNKPSSINYQLIFKEMNKIVKTNCDSIKNSLSEQIKAVNEKTIKNERAIKDMGALFDEKLKNLSDRISVLEGKLISPKIKYINVVSNDNLSFNDDRHKYRDKSK